MTEAHLVPALDYERVVYMPAPASPLKPLAAGCCAIGFITGDHHCTLCKSVGWSSLVET